jgi:hypothetical protein
VSHDDSSGQSTTVTRRLDPRTVQLTLASRPSGLQLALGSRTATASFASTVIVGSVNALAAPTPQTVTGGSYSFVRWSDGGARSHTVTAGSTAKTYTATFTATSCTAGWYRAQYYPNRTLSGTPTLTACEAAPLDRNWRYGAPSGAGVGVNDFSARWIGSFPFPGGVEDVHRGR